MEPLPGYQVFPYPIKQIYADGDFNCRDEFTAQSVKDLADSIIEIGKLAEPVWLQPAADVPGGLPDGYLWRLIAGHRRLLAARTYLKWAEIPGVLWEGLTDRQARLLNLTENMERKDLTPFEEARAIGRMTWPNGMSVEKVAKELKRSGRWAFARLRILRLAPEIQMLVHTKRVTLLDLELVCAQETPEKQLEVANALAKVPKNGRGRVRPAVLHGKKLRRSFRRRKNKAEINEMVAKLMGLKFKGLYTRLLAWSAGHISDDELEQDIQTELVMLKGSAT